MRKVLDDSTDWVACYFLIAKWGLKCCPGISNAEGAWIARYLRPFLSKYTYTALFAFHAPTLPQSGSFSHPPPKYSYIPLFPSIWKKYIYWEREVSEFENVRGVGSRPWGLQRWTVFHAVLPNPSRPLPRELSSQRGSTDISCKLQMTKNGGGRCWVLHFRSSVGITTN